MAITEDEAHPPLSSGANAALGAVGEAAAFIAGAPIAGAADSAIGLGEVVATREAKFEAALTGGPAKPATSRWIWLAIAVVVVAIGLLVALR